MLLCAESGRAIAQVAENLGVGKNLLYRWRREYHSANGQYVSPGNGVEVLNPEQKADNIFLIPILEKLFSKFDIFR